MQPWKQRMIRLPSAQTTTIKVDDIDDLMEGLSAPRLDVTASYVLNDEPDEEEAATKNDNRLAYIAESEETNAILMELHRDALQELEDFLAKQETTQIAKKISESEMCISNSSLRVDTGTLNEQSFDDEDFGDFQSASFDREENEAAETFQPMPQPDPIQMLTTTTPTDAMLAKKNGREHWATNDDDDIFVSPADTCDLERQVDEMLGPLAICRSRSESSSSLDTPDLLAQAEIVVRATLQQQPPLTPVLISLPPVYSTPLRSSSPREVGRVSPNSAQIRRQQTLPPEEPNGTKLLSLRLPVDDLSSLLGRFIHRRQRHFQNPALSPKKQITDSMEELGLPDYYYKSRKTDDTIRILQDFPWVCIDQWNEWDNAITQRLCNLDGALERLQAESLQGLAPLGKHLECANQDIHDAEQSLRLAVLYWERSNDAVEAAHSGWRGYQTYREEFAERDSLKLLDCVLHRVEHLVTECQRLVHDVEHFTVADPLCVKEYKLLVEKRQQLQCDLTDFELEHVACLEETKQKVKALPDMFRERLFHLLQRLVVRSCRGKHDELWEQYSRLIQLHEIVTVDTDRDACRWAETIFKVVLFELDRCLTMALLEPESMGVSKYDVELRRLFHDVNDNWGDTTGIRAIAHNLVVIRFDLEVETQCLPRVVRSLCKLLATCLNRFRLFKQWHRSPVVDMGYDEQRLDYLPNDTINGTPFHTSIVKLLEDRNSELWEATLSVYTKCFEEYLNCSPNNSLFKRKKNGLDDSRWKVDLIDLFQCVTLSERMINLKDQVCGENPQCARVLKAEETLLHHIANVIRRHLRIVHVEAMNSLGRKLSKANWSLVVFSNQCEPETTGRPSKDAFTLIHKALEASDPFPRSSLQREVNQRWKSTSDNCTSRFARIFDIPCSDKELHWPIRPSATSVAGGTAVEVFLDGIIRSCDDEPRLASSSLCKDILEWFGRLSAIMTNLKLVTDDVAAAFANITDLYITTVLRICSGNKTAESIILGADLPSAYVFPKFPTEVDEGGTSKPTALFGSFRKRTSLLTRRIFNTALPPYIHADICSPLPNEQESLRDVRDFIFRAQRSLEDIVNLDMVDPWLSDSARGDSLEEKACLSAQILMKREAAIMSSVVLSYVVALTVDNANRPQEELKAFQAYARSLLQVTLPLSRVTRKISTVRSLNCAEIVKDILLVGDGWDESKLHENANGYVDEVSDLCALLWGYMNASGKMPEPLQATVWHSILQMVYVTFVEGFSRVTNCSTEGRALMSLDAACLAANLNRNSVQERCSSVVIADPPPEPKSVEFHRTLVDSYIKAFYLPVNDAMQWIKSNTQMFHLNHCIALIVAVAQSSRDPAHGREATVRQLVEEVKLIYRQ